MKICTRCGGRFRTASEELHHDCPGRYADHMNRARERLAERTHDAEAEVDGFRYWCRWCGKGYQMRTSLGKHGYCRGGECGAQAAAEWNRAVSAAASARS